MVIIYTKGMDVMELQSLKAQIKSGKLQNVYVFSGPEIAIQDIYIQQMAKKSNRNVVRFFDTSELIQRIKFRSIIKTAQISVLRDCKEFLTDDKLNELVLNEKRKNDDIFIFVYSTIDKRTKFYKSHSDMIIEFEHLKTETLVKYIQKEIDLSDRAAEILSEICANDYSRILLEIDKIKCFANSNTNNVNMNKVFKCLLEDGTIYQPPYDAVFDFVDAVLKQKYKMSFSLLEESYNSGESTLVLISNLYNSTKQLLQVQSYQGNNIASATGLNGFQIKLAKERVGKYTEEQLMRFMEILQEAEIGIKTGKIEDSIAVSYSLLRFWYGCRI